MKSDSNSFLEYLLTNRKFKGLWDILVNTFILVVELSSMKTDKHPVTSCFVILEARPQPHLYCLLCQCGVNDWSYFQHPES